MHPSTGLLALLLFGGCAASHPLPEPVRPLGGCPEGMAFTAGGAFTSLQGPQQIAAHCLDRTEFTVAAYQRCVDAGACSPPDAFELHGRWNQQSLCNWKHPEGRADHPVNCVTWPQAVAACAFEGKRLPSDDEFEWAMRNGPSATTYPWGNEAPRPEHANGCGAECPPDQQEKPGVTTRPLHQVDDGYPETAPVGRFPAGDNAGGVHDLAGNVEEWTASQYGHQEARRHRGGSFITGDPDFFSTRPSDADHPLMHDPALGFRCAAEPR